jgi:hypothetical protein
MSQDLIPPARKWQEIAAEAAKEADSEKLRRLAEELERALDDRDKKPAPHCENADPDSTICYPFVL